MNFIIVFYCLFFFSLSLSLRCSLLIHLRDFLLFHFSENKMANVDMDSMSEQIQAEVQVKQFRDFLVQYNKLSENCFNDCVWDFTSRSVRSNEENCVLNCVEKYTKVRRPFCINIFMFLHSCVLFIVMRTNLFTNVPIIFLAN